MRKTICLIIFALILWGCATFNPSYRQGTQAAMNKNWDEAIQHLEKAALEDPNNSVYRIALIRAKLAASYDHLNKARELASRGEKEEALAEYRKALSYGQLGSDIVEEAKRLTEEKPEEEKPKEVKIEPPVRLMVSDEKIVLRFPVEVSLRSIYQALGKHARVNIILDDQFRDIPFSIELVDMSFEQALHYLCMASKNFYRIVDEKTVIVAPDLPQKRAQYELNAIKTFYLSNINAEEIRAQFMQILRTSMGRAPILIVDKNLNSVTIRDAPEVLELAEKLIQLWDKPKGEIVLDLEIMEVSRIRLKQLGVEFQTELGENYMGVRYRVEDTEDEGWQSLEGLDLTKVGNFQISLPAAVLQFLESDADTKIISQPRLRGIDGEEMIYLVGDKIPIPRTTFTPIAAGGISQQPVTNFQFEDVGIDVKITPRIHIEKEVTLELEIKIKSIGGTGFANIPIIATREVKNVIRLKDGETNLLAGLLKDEERKIHSGIVGLKNIPLLGGLFSSTDQTVQQTDVILTITPHIIRTIPLSEEDMKPLWVGLEGVTPTGGREEMPPEEAVRTQRQILRDEAMTARRGQNQIMLSPPNVETRQNREVRINVNLRIQEDVSNMSLSISFDPEVISLKEVVRREFLNRLGEDVPFFQNIDNSAGICTLGFSSPEMDKGLRGTGTFAVLVFEPVSQGESEITVAEVSANGPTGESADFSVSRQSRVVVR